MSPTIGVPLMDLGEPAIRSGFPLRSIWQFTDFYMNSEVVLVKVLVNQVTSPDASNRFEACISTSPKKIGAPLMGLGDLAVCLGFPVRSIQRFSHELRGHMVRALAN